MRGKTDDHGSEIGRKLARVWKLLEDTPGGASMKEIITKTGISQRTAFRYLHNLKSMSNIRKVQDPVRGTCYQPAPDEYLPPLELKRNEVLALSLLCCDFVLDANVPLLRDAVPAFQKLLGRLSGETRAYLRKHADWPKIQIAPLAVLGADKADVFYEDMVRARERGWEVSVDYDSFTEGEVIQTVIRPYALRFHRRAWYCIGHSSLHKEVRTFHMGRVKALRTQKKSVFLIPPGWSVEKYLGNAWSLMNEGKDWEVCVRFLPMVARNVADVRWHKTQRFVWHEDGRMDYHVTVSSLMEIQWWILGYADQAEVIAPPELREMVKARIKRMAEMYGE